MTLEEILKMLRAQPFVPFIVRLSSNSSYVINHPGMVLPTTYRLLIGIPSSSVPEGGYADYVILSLYHVAELILLGTPTASSSSTNGSN